MLCLLEASSIAISHAAPTHLEKLDSLQHRFLRHIGLDEREAFLNKRYNLAPLQLRRDIGALGLLHKIQLGEAHEDFESLLPKLVHPFTAGTRRNERRHGRQFFEQFGRTDYFNRSLFSMCRVYNVLPWYVFQAESVSLFQKLLTKDAKFACRHGTCEWQIMYNNRAR